MSWQERVERYKAEQADVANREREAKLAVLKEKVPPLLEALDKLNCAELLIQIRDEIWKLGEIEVKPDLTHLDSDMAIKASASLVARWPVFVPSYNTSEASSDVAPNWSDPEIIIHEEILAIGARYEDAMSEKIMIGAYTNVEIRDEDKSFKEEGSFPADEQDARSKLEERLIRETILRQKMGVGRPWGMKLPYDQRKKEAEPGVVEAVARGEVELPEGFDYLLEPVEKARKEIAAERETAEAQARQNLSSAKPRSGLLGRFFGKK